MRLMSPLPKLKLTFSRQASTRIAVSVGMVLSFLLGYLAAKRTDGVTFYTLRGMRMSFPSGEALAGLDIGFYVAMGEAIRGDRQQRALRIADMCLDAEILDAWERHKALSADSPGGADLDRVLRLASGYRRRYPRTIAESEVPQSVKLLQDDVDRILSFYGKEVSMEDADSTE